MAKQVSAKEQAQAAKAARTGRATDYQRLVNTQIRNHGKNSKKGR